MSGNVFSGKRFVQLLKQHFIHNSQLYLLSTIAYIGVIIIVLSITQMGNDFLPHNLDIFQGYLVAFVSIFGILYVGHSFSAFRSKERTLTYLMIPGSHLEKFLLEFLIKICLPLLALPVLYWLTFHLQGYFFSIFIMETFEPIGFQYLTRLEINGDLNPIQVKWMIGCAIFLALSLAFTGSAMFSKQPLVKTLFAVAVIVMFFTAYSYIVLVELGVNNYTPRETMWILPNTDSQVLISLSVAFLGSALLMLFVAYRKLTEKEV